jgi:hypothetical protein
MARLRNVRVQTYYVERKATLKARRKGWSVRSEPLPGKKTSSFALGFALGGRGVRNGERFDNWEVFLVIISNRELAPHIGGMLSIHGEPVSAIIEERVLGIHICGHIGNRQIIDAVYTMKHRVNCGGR